MYFFLVEVEIWYVCNSLVINGIYVYILCSVFTIGRELRFLFENNVSNFPRFFNIGTEYVMSYFQLVEFNRSFALNILKVFMKDHKVVHVEYINNNRNDAMLYPDDIGMVRTIPSKVISLKIKSL